MNINDKNDVIKMNINDKNDVIKWLKRLKDEHPLSTNECLLTCEIRYYKKDATKVMVATDQVIKDRYQGMIDYLESDEVTSGPTDKKGIIRFKP